MKGIPKEILDRIEWKSTGEMDAAVPVPKRITHEPKPCEDCGMSVTDRRIAIRRRETPQLHWARQCLNCKLQQHPETGEYTVEPKDYGAVFRHYISERDK